VQSRKSAIGFRSRAPGCSISEKSSVVASAHGINPRRGKLRKFSGVAEMNLQFRADLFNLLNRANFNTRNAVVFTPRADRLPPADYRHVRPRPGNSIRMKLPW
jgi:hypothetical protein